MSISAILQKKTGLQLGVTVTNEIARIFLKHPTLYHIIGHLKDPPYRNLQNATAAAWPMRHSDAQW